MSNDQAFPTLSDEMIDIARRYGSESTIAAGEFAFVEGQLSYDLVVIVDGSFSILRPRLERRTAPNGSSPRTGRDGSSAN